MRNDNNIDKNKPYMRAVAGTTREGASLREGKIIYAKYAAAL